VIFADILSTVSMFVDHKTLNIPLSTYILISVSMPSVSFAQALVTDLPVYRVSQEERTKLREGVPYVKL